jgi:hypothetical protein
VSYQKTFGARKERATQAYNEVIRILIRNLLNNNRVLAIPEINRILQTKSRENKVKVSDLPDEISCVFALYTRIAEDEMLPSKNREELLSEINTYLEQVEREAPTVVEEIEKPPPAKEEAYLRSSEFYLALVSIATGLIAGLILNFLTATATLNILNMLPPIAVTITAVIGITSVFARMREKSTTLVMPTVEAVDFEDRIFKILKELGDTKKEFSLPEGLPSIRFDFFLMRGGSKFLIEVKWFRSYASNSSIRRLNAIARTIKDLNKDYVLILVVNDKKFLAAGLPGLSRIWDYVFDESELKEFRNKLVHA